MERQRSERERRLVRCSEPSRQEGQVLALAYEQIWPLLRRVPQESRPEGAAQCVVAANDPVPTTRSV